MVTNLRLFQLNKNLDLAYEKLGAMEKSLIMAVDPEMKISIRQRIREEILPDLKKYQAEYYQLLAQETNSLITDDFDENEANNIIVEIVQVTDDLIKQNNNQQVIDLLNQIKEKLNEPQKSASAKLKAAIPLIPGFLSYELEADTEGFLKRAFPTFSKLLPKK